MKTRILFFLLFLSTCIHGYSQAPVKNIFIEDNTGIWCGWCPYGAGWIDTMEKYHPGKIVPIALHMADKYSNHDDSTYLAGMHFPGDFPTVTLDRHVTYFPDSFSASGYDTNLYYMPMYIWSSTISLDSLVDVQLALVPSCNVSVAGVIYDSVTRNITATVNADFASADSGDLRLDLFITEDSILTHNEQVNNDNTSAGTPFYGRGDPMATWYQNHICRAMCGGPWGVGGIIPTTVLTGGSYSKSFSYKLPAAYNAKYINLIGTVQRYNTDYTKRDIVNCTTTRLSTVTAINTISVETGVSIYPNPASNTVFIQTGQNKKIMQVEIINELGEIIRRPTEIIKENGALKLDVSTLANGVYIIRLITENEPLVIKFIKE